MPCGTRTERTAGVGVLVICAYLAYSVNSAEEPAQEPKPAQTAQASAETPADDKSLKTVFPPHQAVLLSGDFDLICKLDEDATLEVDGEILEWEPFQPPLRVAHVNLYNGRNQLKLGHRQLEVFVARGKDDPGKPEGWEVYRRHSIEGHGAKRCGDCHQIKTAEDRTSVGELKSYKACFECHKPVEFEAIHSHPLEPLEPCQSCHALHGSTRKSLLKAPVKKLCDECHES